MSLITVVRDVCAVVGVAAPTSVFAAISSNRTMLEMLACANEMAQRIAYDTRDWSALLAQHELVGENLDLTDPTSSHPPKTVFPLPANFKRMLLTGNVWRTDISHTPMKYVSDYDEWLQRRLLNDNNANGEWIIFNGAMIVSPGLSLGTSATFFYLDKNCINLASGGVSDRFASDDDTYRLDERLLKLGMTYDWKMKKGSPYAEDMGTYSDAIAMAMGHDKPSPIYVGGRPMADLWGGHAQRW